MPKAKPGTNRPTEHFAEISARIRLLLEMGTEPVEITAEVVRLIRIIANDIEDQKLSGQ